MSTEPRIKALENAIPIIELRDKIIEDLVTAVMKEFPNQNEGYVYHNISLGFDACFENMNEFCVKQKDKK